MKSNVMFLGKIPALLAGTLWLASICAAQAGGTPKLQFDRLVYDFGKTSQVESVSGVFKFKNTGDGLLKLEPPKPSCGCTIARLHPDTLQPGESGELPFVLHLGKARAQLDKRIAVRSNDPKTPEVSLIIKADYTPLYDLNPMTLAPRLEFGMNETALFTTIARTDGQPLHLAKLVPTKPWITATIDPAAKDTKNTARIRIAITREGAPRRFNEFVHLYAADQTNTPVSSIYVSGQIMGAISLSPEALYWSVTDAATTAQRPEAQVLRRVTIRSADGKPMEVKNPQSTIKGIKVELVTREAGKVYELVARLEAVPPIAVSGIVSFETSSAAQSRIEVPVTVNVFKP
jgi:hypothetical protein